MGGKPLSGEEVIAVGKEASPRAGALLRDVLVALDRAEVT